MSVSLGWRANVIILSPPDGLMQLGELVTYLDAYLRVGEVPDAPHALNGLQVAKTGDVNRVAAAVDLCEATVRMAVAQESDLLLVHHGLFWGGLKPLTGPAYRRVAGLMQNNIALYSAHLPLDMHPEVGNNAVLARQLGVTLRGGFGMEYGVSIGVWGGLDTYITGEGAHHTFFDAEELGVNVFYGGHYATETVGIKALGEHLCAKFGLPWTFLDHPTGL